MPNYVVQGIVKNKRLIEFCVDDADSREEALQRALDGEENRRGEEENWGLNNIEGIEELKSVRSDHVQVRAFRLDSAVESWQNTRSEIESANLKHAEDEEEVEDD